MTHKDTHWILAYYLFTPIDDPQGEVSLHQAFLAEKDVSCRVYISEQGINGQLCAIREDAQLYIEWMQQRPEFKTVKFKIHPYHEHVFPRKTIKYRKQLVAIDTTVDLSNTGEHVPPKRWKEMLECTEDEKILIDVRNDYEWKVGRFANAELPPCETFRDFTTYADELKEKTDPKKTPIMMYCTGGIRCELYSAILKEKGFEKVYQLDGGVIGYGLEEGSTHWLGKLFVFDDRLAVPICDQESPKIGICHHCGQTNDNYYNCANMDCNHLFLCCPDCLQEFAGCCGSDCMSAPRRRPFHEQNPHKPFRRWYHYEKDLPPESLKHKKNIKD